MVSVEQPPSPRENHTSLADLPVEVISRIITFAVLDTDARTQIKNIKPFSLLNRWFQRVTFNTPDVWTKIYISGKSRSLRLADLSIDRSKTRNLYIEVDCLAPGHRAFQYAVDIITSHSSQICSLSAHFETQQQYDLFRQISSNSIPNLQCLNFDYHLDLNEWDFSDRRLTLALPDTPRLQELSLKDCLPIVAPSLSRQALTTLRLYGHLDPPQIEFKTLLSLVLSAPNLIDLWMDGCEVNWDLDEPYVPVCCSNLRRLVLRKMSSEFCWQLLAHLELPELATIHFKPRGSMRNALASDSEKLDRLSLPSLRTFSLDLYSRSVKEQQDDVMDQEEILRMANTVGRKFQTTRCLVIEAESDQIRMLLGEWSTMTRAGKVPFPQLETLTLGRTPKDPADEEIATTFFSQRGEQGFAQVQLDLKDKLLEEEKGLDSTGRPVCSSSLHMSRVTVDRTAYSWLRPSYRTPKHVEFEEFEEFEE